MGMAPWIWTLVPTGPLAGAKQLMVGGLAVRRKLPTLLTVPPSVVTLVGPPVAAAGTAEVGAVDLDARADRTARRGEVADGRRTRRHAEVAQATDGAAVGGHADRTARCGRGYGCLDRRG